MSYAAGIELRIHQVVIIQWLLPALLATLLPLHDCMSHISKWPRPVVSMCEQVHKLRQQEQEGQQTKPKRPRALVLGPTRELTDQILQVAKSLCHHARFRSACVNGGDSSCPGPI